MLLVLNDKWNTYVQYAQEYITYLCILYRKMEEEATDLAVLASPFMWIYHNLHGSLQWQFGSNFICNLYAYTHKHTHENVCCYYHFYNFSIVMSDSDKC